MNFRTFFSRSEKYFQKGTKQRFWLYEVLLLSNLFLFSLAIFEFYNWLNDIEPPHWIHMVEFIFGALFLFELLFHLLHVYIPNKVFFKPILWINAIVIVSLLYPAAFGNLAILRALWAVKIIKIYLYNKKLRKDIARNPEMEMHSVKLVKATGKGVQVAGEGAVKAAETGVKAVSKGAQAAGKVAQTGAKVVGKGVQNAGKGVEAARERIFVKAWKAQKRDKHNEKEKK